MINRVILLGNLGGDPEVKYMPSGKAVANLSLATSESWRDKQSGEKQEKTEWHRISFFDKTAEICQKYLAKGDTIYVEGKIQTRKWQDKEGNDRWSTEIVGQRMQMIKTKGSERGADTGQETAQPPAEFDDEIPFAFILPLVSSPFIIGLVSHAETML